MKPNIALLLVLIAILLAAGCGRGPTSLSGVEVTDYKGEKLGSITDFHENSIKGPQYVNTSPERYTLRVNGLVDKEMNYSYDQAIGFPSYSKVVTLDCVEGWSVKILWEGVLVKDLIKEAHPKPNATTVIFYAYDGYTTSLPLDYIESGNIMMAYKMNGVVLPPENGYPFQLVAESKWGYKWIKWIKRIELSDNPNYLGTWESAGYSHSGDLNGSVYEKDVVNG